MKRIMMTLGIAAMALTGCNEGKEAGKPAIDLANFDTTTAPGEDFYQYACGGWMEANPLTPEYARYGIFDQLDKENQEKLKALIEDLNATPQVEGSVGAKIQTMYALGLDMEKRNADGAAPVKAQMEAIKAISNRQELSAMVGKMHVESASPFFGFYIGADEKNSTMNLLQFSQGGLSMGSREYYLLEDENSARIREAYRKYVNTLFTLAGYTPEEAAKATDSVIALETEIAKVSLDRNALRDVKKNYNKMTVKDFVRNYNFLDWNIFFNEVGIRNSTELNASQVTFFEGMTKLMKKVALEDQKEYLVFKLLTSASSYLSEDFVKYFPASSKEKMLEMVENLRTALGERINSLEWMSDETKAKAHEKLGTFIVKIGYPDKWKDYTELDIRNDSYWANICRANVFGHKEMMAREGQPVDRTEWGMSPQTVNAYYNPTTNEICFPAAILNPPFFNPDADDAVNYGGIGVVIGHEMTHGFDDQGRNYDKDGNISSWWTDEDEKKFNEMAQVLVKQYDEIIVLDTLHADGKYTLGENIADQGGLLIAHQAYMNTLKGKETPAEIDGFTHNQRFYLGYANLWAQNVRPQEIIRRTKTDVHSLGKWRVNGALRNIDDFYAAFGIKEGDPMYMAPEERINIW